VADATRSLALANLQRDTALAWLDRHYQERMREMLVAQRDEAKLQVDAADAAYRGGRGSQADAFAARAAVALIEDRIAQAERQVATATTQLARWVGSPAAEPLAAAPPLDSVDPRAGDPNLSLAHHPDIAILQKREELAQAEAEVARTNKQTDVSVELMFSQRGPAYSNMVSLNLAIPLQWDAKNRQDRELAAKLALVERARAEREETVRMHEAETRSMLQEWRSNRERLLRYDSTLLPLAGIAPARPSPLTAAAACWPRCSTRDGARSTRASNGCVSRWTPRGCGRRSTSWSPPKRIPLRRHAEPAKDKTMTTNKTRWIVALAAVAIVATGYGMYLVGMQRGMGMAAAATCPCGRL
jgi:hypothetical protein